MTQTYQTPPPEAAKTRATNLAQHGEMSELFNLPLRRRVALPGRTGYDELPGEMKLGLRRTLASSRSGPDHVFVGMMSGWNEPSSIIGEKEFGLVSKTAIVSFIVSFGVRNHLQPVCRSGFGNGRRKKVLVVGWLVGFIITVITSTWPG